MRRLIVLSLLLALISCESLKEEFQPVFTGQYPNPEKQAPVSMTANTTIGELASMYTINKPWNINKDIVISGVISTTDKPGNFYKSFYIQDETGGMEIKIGKNSLYNDYLPGQRIYVKCDGLCLGMYGYKSGNYGGYGMVQLGFSDPSGEYETSYLENSLLIDNHIFKGNLEGLVTPVVLKDNDFPKGSITQAQNSNIGKLVTINDLTYGGSEEDVFVLLYVDSNQDKKKTNPKNRIFISGKNTGITSWAMSKEKMTSMLESGIWDKVLIGDSGQQIYGTVGDKKDKNGKYAIEKNVYSVSHYFHTNSGSEIQIRTSGFSKFADNEIDPDVLAGRKKISVTGILTLYQGGIQISVNDITDIVIQ